MNTETIKQLVLDAEQYSLARRTAAALYLAGMTEQDVLKALFHDAGAVLWGKCVKADIQRELFRIENGEVTLTPRLEELARQLVQPQSVWVVQYLDDDGKYGATAKRTHEEAYAIGSRERSWKLDEVQL